jgi:hypothetical protein
VWKFLRYTIYLAVTLTLFLAAYNIRVYIYIPQLESFLYKQTGHKFDIGNFYIRPFKGGVAFVNVSVDNKIASEEIFIKFSIKKILKN